MAISAADVRNLREKTGAPMMDCKKALEATGGELSWLADGGAWFVGPEDERWDLAMLITQNSLEDFFAFATNEAYLAGVGHRDAAVEDVRMLALDLRRPAISP